MTTKAQAIDQEEAADRLRELVSPGDTVHCILRHVARSGMLRRIDLVKIGEDGSVFYLTRLASRLRGDRTPADNGDGLKAYGAGMDMGFDAVYTLSAQLYREGFACVGERCPANDHSNGDRDYTPGHVVHRDGGYALRHRWL